MDDNISPETIASGIAGIDFKLIAIDHLSLVRYVHATALRLEGAHTLDEVEIDCFCDGVYTAQYSAHLMKQELIGAWIDGELVGTAGWHASDDGRTARIASVFVRPPFTRLRIGTRLMEAIEGRCRRAGFKTFSLRATDNSVSFFERLGYAVTAHGLKNLAFERGVPITFMRKSDVGCGHDDDTNTSPSEKLAADG